MGIFKQRGSAYHFNLTDFFYQFSNLVKEDRVKQNMYNFGMKWRWEKENRFPSKIELSCRTHKEKMRAAQYVLGVTPLIWDLHVWRS